jgi:segregation and condensation protein B
MMQHEDLRPVVEGLIIASPEPLAANRITQVLAEVTQAQVARAVAELNTKYAEGGSSFRIREIAGGYQYYILPNYVGYVEDLFTRRRKMRLTQAALETLAVIAYKQPVTKTEIEHIRGVASDGVIHNLMEKNMITVKGRAKAVGKPLQYGTTDEFLKFFGLNSLDDLPRMSEIEEMIAAVTPKQQTQLPLNMLAAAAPAEIKLNIADGSFTPRDESDMAELELEDAPAPGAESGPTRLILRAGPEDIPDEDLEDDSTESESDEVDALDQIEHER